MTPLPVPSKALHKLLAHSDYPNVTLPTAENAATVNKKKSIFHMTQPRENELTPGDARPGQAELTYHWH